MFSNKMAERLAGWCLEEKKIWKYVEERLVIILVVAATLASSDLGHKLSLSEL